CLAKNPDQRPPSARDLAERFETALAHEEVIQEMAVPADHPQTEPPVTAVVAATVDDPDAVVYHVEAWMPESIAVSKLRGFMYDVGGDVIQSVPGRICVQLGGPGSAYQLNGRGLSWLGLGRKTGQIELDLRMQQIDAERQNHLLITVVMRSLDGNSTFDPSWRALAAQVFCDLRGYLMGKTGLLNETP